MCVK